MQTTATVSRLKMSLSAYLRQVKAGEEVVITEHGRPIARLLPLASVTSVPDHVREMEAQGLLKRGGNRCPRISGTCRDRRTRTEPCVQRSYASGKRADAMPQPSGQSSYTGPCTVRCERYFHSPSRWA